MEIDSAVFNTSKGLRANIVYQRTENHHADKLYVILCILHIISHVFIYYLLDNVRFVVRSYRSRIFGMNQLELSSPTGHTRQGLRCRLCKMNVHTDCMPSVGKCQTKSRLLRRQKSTSEIESHRIQETPFDDESEFSLAYRES